MSRLILVSLLIAVMMFGAVAPVLAGDVYVRGYTRRDGTYVQPHYRSAPDSSYNNNWSTYPNVNPYTGQQGTNAPRVYDVPSTNTWGSGSDSGLGGTYGTPLGGGRRR